MMVNVATVGHLEKIIFKLQQLNHLDVGRTNIVTTQLHVRYGFRIIPFNLYDFIGWGWPRHKYTEMLHDDEWLSTMMPHTTIIVRLSWWMELKIDIVKAHTISICIANNNAFRYWITKMERFLFCRGGFDTKVAEHPHRSSMKKTPM